MPDSKRPKRLVCFVNGIYSTQIGGGDIYFSHIARAALDAGYDLHFFGGHALKHYLEQQGFPMNLTLTDTGIADLGEVGSLGGQFRLLFDFRRRLNGALRQLDAVQPDDLAYAMSDFWFDSIPLMRCRARRKIMYLGMMAPTLKEVLTRGRADVTGTRLNSLYYWMSQQYSVRRFRRLENRTFTYSHPEMKDYLKRFGYRDEELAYVANGMDVSAAERVPEQEKSYDLVWTGRVHPQKGIDDLLATLAFLAGRMEDFKAVIIGKSRDQLQPRIRELGLEQHVDFPGLVSEEEKFRLLKASRVFAMPSRYESWGIVIGEALAAGIPVVGYELNCYRPVFGEFVRYAEPFNQSQFQALVEREVRAMREGRNYLDQMDLNGLKKTLSWTTAQKAFQEVLDR